MVSEGVFIFKGIQYKKGGEFTNEKGELVKYNESLVLKFDESGKDENGNVTCDERFIKIKNLNEKESLINKLKEFAIYNKIKLVFENKFSKDGGVVLNLIDVDKVSTK